MLCVSFISFLFAIFNGVVSQSSASSNASASATPSASAPVSGINTTTINASLPLCAILSCRQVLTNSNSECPNATASCLCRSQEFVNDAASCIRKNCFTDTDQHNAYDFAVQVCAQVGVTLPSFDQIGQSSGSVRIHVTTSIITLAVVVGTLFFVGGLL